MNNKGTESLLQLQDPQVLLCQASGSCSIHENQKNGIQWPHIRPEAPKRKVEACAKLAKLRGTGVGGLPAPLLPI